MLNQDQYQLLQSFVSMPDPTYAEIFALQHEIQELEGEVSDIKDELEEAQDELKDVEQEKEEHVSRCIELEAALADALFAEGCGDGVDGGIDGAHVFLAYWCWMAAS